MKYIDAELLREKIEKTYKSEIQPWLSGVSAASAIYDYVLPLIDSLQEEQPDLPGIEESGIPGKDYIPVEWVDACEKYGKWKIVKQDQPNCHTVEDWMQHIKNADQLTKEIFSKGPYDVLYDALNYPYQYCYDAIKEFGELCFRTGVNSVKQEQPEVDLEKEI